MFISSVLIDPTELELKELPVDEPELALDVLETEEEASEDWPLFVFFAFSTLFFFRNAKMVNALIQNVPSGFKNKLL